MPSLLFCSQIFLTNCSSLKPFLRLSLLSMSDSVLAERQRVHGHTGLFSSQLRRAGGSQEMSTLSGTRNPHQQSQDRGGQKGTLRHTITFLKHKRWMNALNKNTPHILQTGHPDRSGLCINQITSWHFIWDSFSYPKLQIMSVFCNINPSPKSSHALISLTPFSQEGRGLVRAQHPGSTKIEEFLGQLEVLWEELRRRHQRNAMFLQVSEELGFRVRFIKYFTISSHL